MYTKRLVSCAVLLLFSSMTSIAQEPTAAIAAGPTTRVLAIGHMTSTATRDKVMPIMRQEVQDTVRLYLSGKLDQWFVRRDQNGVIFILNVSTLAEARELLGKLPLDKAKLLEFDLIPLGPLTPLGLLIQDSPAKQEPPAK